VSYTDEEALEALSKLDNGKSHAAKEIARHLRETHPDMEHTFTRGGCFKFYEMLRANFPDAEPYYDPIEGHVYVNIDNRYFDIKGELEDASKLVPLEEGLSTTTDPTRWAQEAFFNKEAEDDVQPST